MRPQRIGEEAGLLERDHLVAFGGHIFDGACKQHGTQHTLTKPYRP